MVSRGPDVLIVPPEGSLLWDTLEREFLLYKTKKLRLERMWCQHNMKLVQQLSWYRAVRFKFEITGIMRGASPGLNIPVWILEVQLRKKYKTREDEFDPEKFVEACLRIAYRFGCRSTSFPDRDTHSSESEY